MAFFVQNGEKFGFMVVLRLALAVACWQY